jgi:hypothetical protein
LKEALNTLANYLKENIPELKQAITNWPDPKVQMSLPCISIIPVGTPRITHTMPTLKTLSDSDSPLKRKSLYLVGHYDYVLQVDLWTEYQAERDMLFEKILDTFNKQFSDGGPSSGLSLQMTNYHNAFASYEQIGYTYLDSEDNSIRSEWRVKIDVNVMHERFSEREEFVIDEIKIKSRIDEYVDPANDATNEETIV